MTDNKGSEQAKGGRVGKTVNFGQKPKNAYNGQYLSL